MSKILIVLMLAGLVLIPVLLWFVYDRDAFWQSLAGNPDQGQTDFAALQKARKPNEALACPVHDLADICPMREPDIRTPSYDLTPSELAAKLIAVFSSNPQVVRVDDGTSPLKLRFVRRTAWMRFPDTFSVEIIPLANNKATLAIHGKALVGHSDMGNNLNLVKQALDQLSGFESAR